MKKLVWSILPLLMLCTSIAVLAQDADKPSSQAEPKPAEAEEGEAEDAEGEAVGEAEEEKVPEPAELGKKAPDFTLKNADGEEVGLSDYEDKIVVLEWISLDCPWCKVHYEKSDELVKLQKKLRDEGVVWLTICSSAEGRQGHFDDDTLKKRIKKVDLKPGFYLKDADGKVGKKYGARTTPHCYVIDKEGKVRYMGALDNLRERRGKDDVKEVHYVKDAVEALQNDKEVAKSETKPYG